LQKERTVWHSFWNNLHDNKSIINDETKRERMSGNEFKVTVVDHVKFHHMVNLVGQFAVGVGT
jgi:hypothetical protein